MLQIRAQVDPFLQALLKTIPWRDLLLLVWQSISQDNLCYGVLHGSLLLILVAAAFKGGGQVIQTRVLHTGGVSTVPAKQTAVFWGSQGCGSQFSWAPSCSVFYRLFVLGVFLHFFCSCFSFSPRIGITHPETPTRRIKDYSASFLDAYPFSLTSENSFVATGEVPLLLDVALRLLGGKLTQC